MLSSSDARPPIHDALARAIGIPMFGLAIPWVFDLYGPHTLRDGVTWLGAAAFLALSAAIWQGNRWLLLRQRTTRDWLERPARRMATLLVGIVLYTAPLTAFVLRAWEGFAHVHVDLRAVVLTNVICVVFVSHAYETVLLIKDRESDGLTLARLERTRAEAELLALRRQIDPHFIFNCLNTLQHLVTADPSRAASFVRDFAGVTRYLLSTSDKHTVTLGEEIDFTQRYASLLSIRFGDAFRLELIDEGGDRSATIPPTSLQLLVENAAKHNVFHAERPLVVQLALRPGEVEVTNARVPREDARVGGAALGLENLAERVRLCTDRPLVIEDAPQRFRVTVPLSAPDRSRVMRLVLLEDEPPAMAQLRAAVVAARPDARVEAEFATLVAARAWFATHTPPDLVISDIILADGNALALFREGRVNCPVVFATAHDAYLLEAFRCAAIDYLLKPIDPREVARALDKHRDLRTLLAPQSAEAVAQAVAPQARGTRRRILARCGAELRAVDVDDVAYFLADDKLTVLVTADGREHLVDQSLSALALELDPATFFRANRATLVNVRSVRSFRSLGKGRLEVKLSPARVVCVSQENGAAFKAWMSSPGAASRR